MNKLLTALAIGGLALTPIGCEKADNPMTENNEFMVASAPGLLTVDAHEAGFATTKMIIAFPNGKIDRIGHFLEGTQKWVCYFDDASSIPTADDFVTLEGVYLGTLNNGRKVLAGVTVR